MKWSHTAAVATLLLVAACFGWIGVGDTQPSIQVQLGAEGDLLALIAFGLFLACWHWFWSIDHSHKRNIHYVDWHEEKKE